MRIVFAGSPEIAVPSLEAIHESKHEVVCVLTNPDAVRGRGRNACVTRVKEAAVEFGYKLLQPRKLDSSVREEIGSLKPDLLVAVAYGKIFGPKFLKIFPYGGVNLHPSLLPKHRGCSPVNAAILNGDKESGVTIQKLALEMDSGDILLQRKRPMDGTETADSLLKEFAEIGAEMLVETLDGIEKGEITGTGQKGENVTYCSFIKKEDGKIPWEKSAVEINRMFRAYYPWPGIFTYYKDLKLNILDARLYAGEIKFEDSNAQKPGTVLGVDKNDGILIQTGEGVLVVSALQLQAKKAMDFKAFINGNKEFPGSILGGR